MVEIIEDPAERIPAAQLRDRTSEGEWIQGLFNPGKGEPPESGSVHCLAEDNQCRDDVPSVVPVYEPPEYAEWVLGVAAVWLYGFEPANFSRSSRYEMNVQLHVGTVAIRRRSRKFDTMRANLFKLARSSMNSDSGHEFA